MSLRIGKYIIFVIFFFLFSYDLNKLYNLEWPEIESLPILLRFINPDYAIGDFYTECGVTGNPRLIFNSILNGFNLVLGGDIFRSIPVLKYFHNFLFILSYFFFLNFIFEHFAKWRSFAEYAPFFAFVSIIIYRMISDFYPRLAIAGWVFDTTQLIPHNVSITIVLLSTALYKYRDKVKFLEGVQFFLILLSGLIHPIISLMSIIIPALLFSDLIYKKNLWKIYMLFRAPLVGVLLSFFSIYILYENANTIINKDLFFDIYVYDRHPHHYLVSRMGYGEPPIQLIRILWQIMLIGMFSLVFLKIRKLVCFSISSLIIFMSLILVQYYLVEINKINIFITLGLIRLTLFTQIFFPFFPVFTLFFFLSRQRKFTELILAERGILRNTAWLILLIGIPFQVGIVIYRKPTLTMENQEGFKRNRVVLEMLKDLNGHNGEILDLTGRGFEYLIYSGNAIYNHNAFPFNKECIIEFAERKEKAAIYEQEIRKSNFSILNNKINYVITNKKYFDNSKTFTIKNEYLNELFLYKRQLPGQ